MWSIGCWKDEKLCGSGVTFCWNAGWSCTLLKETEIIYPREEVHLSEPGRENQSLICVFLNYLFPFGYYKLSSHWLAVISNVLLTAGILVHYLISSFLAFPLYEGNSLQRAVEPTRISILPVPHNEALRLFRKTLLPPVTSQDRAVTLPCALMGGLLV